MMKEKEIWLDPEEIKQLLEGGLYWNDIESKLSSDNANSMKRLPEKDDSPEIDIEEIIKEASAKAKQPKMEERAPLIKEHDEEDVRAILLGEGKVSLKPEKPPIESNHSIIKDTQIDFGHFERELEPAFLSQAASTEEDNRLESIIREEKEVGGEERNSFSVLGQKEDLLQTRIFRNEISTARGTGRGIGDMIIGDETDEEKESSFGGMKLIILLIVVGIATFGFWYYFLSR
ncbi:MAG: hypothetical protein GX434_09140 [Peptococcaceae bacterium]|nr:hypothetical protein [Peptococcaceae bacterium]